MKVRKLILSILASLPLGIISFAARSAIQDVDDLERASSFKQDIRSRRPLLFETGQMQSSVSESYERFKSRSESISSSEEADFWKLVDEMEKNDLLQRDGEFLLAKAPSFH